MKTIINGIEVGLPKKLESRMDEVTELVNMVKELSNRKGKTLTKIHVWETKRHELCYSDFTDFVEESPKPDVLINLQLPKNRAGSEEKMDLILAERGKVLEAIETSMKVLDTEKQCVERQYNGMCDNKRDCANCDLALDKDTILLGYDRALKCMSHLRNLVFDM